MKRRTFLQGCCASIAAMAGARLTNVTFAEGAGTALGGPRDVLVTVFLRGGMDALSFLVPHSDSNYHIARAVLGLDTAQVLDIDGQFGLHPAAPQLRELMASNHLAIVAACGSPDPSRSHFESQDYMERGKPGDANFSGGWLARTLALTPSQSIFQAISQGSTVATSLEGMSGAIALSGPGDFTVNGNDSDDVRRALRRMYAGDSQLSAVAERTLDAVDTIDFADPDDYVPGHGVVYPSNNSFASSLANVAQLIRLDVGLQAATIDFGGWDTHVFQADGSNPTTGEFANLVRNMSEGLSAFWNDLADYHGRVTVVVMSEFGRRLKENDNRGTDHGHGGIMMVLSANVQQGRVYGTWPGLAYEQLFENVDLAVTTDFRTVLAETLQARLGVGPVDPIFPGFTYPGALGIFATPGQSMPATGFLTR